jgi:hypothetical protein
MSRVKSFQLDTDIVNTYVVYNIPDKTEWKGTRIVDVSNQEIGMNILITMGTLNTSDEMYFENGNEYLDSISPANDPKDTGWIKYQLGNSENAEWNREAQIQNIVELLKTTTRDNYLEDEKVNGVDCYVLLINPTTQAITDWVLSQDQPNGPSLRGSHEPALVGNAFVKAYKNSVIKVWIAKDSYLVVQTELSVHFQTTIEELQRVLDSPFQKIASYFREIFLGSHKITSYFQGQMNFSNYNEPVSIQLPQEALKAQSVGN